ncbi:MAG: TonB-dependent receptor [Bacteroidetes bacterium]|nr:TonB-dependent receptor [Bacteroidota bacterium]
MKHSIKLHLITIFMLVARTLLAQEQASTQTIKGQITDKVTHAPIPGVTIVLQKHTPLKGTTTDIDGYYKLTGVPLGRQEIKISFIGYNELVIPNILVTAGKEVVINVELEENINQMNEVVISANSKDKTLNEMTSVSARTFSMEDVTRYSGSRNDPARMASNFAGVSNSDDSRNDIVIRGNSPTGILFRIDGVTVSNPNHFSTLGTTGGPVSALNTNVLKSSDFMTSAFPAEYGNATAGVFDLGFRTGNTERHEFTAQIGAFTGLELLAEGPISKKNGSSYLIGYRYSFVDFARKAGIPVGTNATPQYQDVSFKVSSGAGKLGRVSLFGLVGLSKIDFLANEIDSNDLFADPSQNSYFYSNMGMVGINHSINIGSKTFLKTTVATTINEAQYIQEAILTDGSTARNIENKDTYTNYFFSSILTHKINSRFNLKGGVYAQQQNMNLFLRSRQNKPDWIVMRDFGDGALLAEAFVQGQYKFTDQLKANVGLHTQSFSLNNTSAIEPRAGLVYQLNEKNSINLGYGMHNQIQPLPIYFFETTYADGSRNATNKDLGFTRSQHFVLAYNTTPIKDYRIRVETYYQLIDNVPVEPTNSSFSMLNTGAYFIFPDNDSLVNTGTGNNYGVELTLEKFFSNGFYGLITGSLYDSKYKGSDGVERNTAFNNKYVLNVLGGKEFIVGKSKQNAITVDFKVTTAGGRFYTPIDLQKSKLANEEVLAGDDYAFTKQNTPYFRADLKFGYRFNSNKRKVSYQFFFDMQNLTNNKNVFVQRYNRLNQKVNTLYQSGFFPDLMFRVQF